MKYNKALIPLNNDFAFNIYDAEVPSNEDPNNPLLHFHDCLEINYVVKGTGINVIENQRFDMKTGDFFVINNLERHMAVPNPISIPNTGLVLKVIVFDPLLVWNKSDLDYSYLKPFFNRSVVFSNKIDAQTSIIEEFIVIIRKIEYEWNNRHEGFKIIIKALLMELLALLYRHFKCESTIGDDVKTFHRSFDRLKPVLDYINSNFTEELSLQLLSEVSLMNRTYFSTFFKKVMQVSVWKYIENLRISRSCLLLKTTNMSVTEICLECGFKDISHFSRVFKFHYEKSPSDYRNSKHISNNSK